jgi:hypothetical protein
VAVEQKQAYGSRDVSNVLSIVDPTPVKFFQWVQYGSVPDLLTSKNMTKAVSK